MKLQKMTVGLLTIAIGMGIIVAGLEWQKQYLIAKKEQASGKFWDLKLEDIQQIAIDTPDRDLTLRKTDNPYNPWQISQPINSPANPAIVAYLTDLLVSAKSDRTFTVASAQKSDFGLVSPSATIALQLKDRSTRKLTLGKPDFKNEFIYATVEPNPTPRDSLTLNLVSKDFQFAIDRDLKEWQTPAEPPTPQATP